MLMRIILSKQNSIEVATANFCNSITQRLISTLHPHCIDFFAALIFSNEDEGEIIGIAKQRFLPILCFRIIALELITHRWKRCER